MHVYIILFVVYLIIFYIIVSYIPHINMQQLNELQNGFWFGA